MVIFRNLTVIWKNLKFLKLKGNSLPGYIPYNFKNLENLKELNLADNFGLKGYIPKMSKIETCDYEATGFMYLENYNLHKYRS